MLIPHVFPTDSLRLPFQLANNAFMFGAHVNLLLVFLCANIWDREIAIYQILSCFVRWIFAKCYPVKFIWGLHANATKVHAVHQIGSRRWRAFVVRFCIYNISIVVPWNQIRFWSWAEIKHNKEGGSQYMSKISWMLIPSAVTLLRYSCLAFQLSAFKMVSLYEHPQMHPSLLFLVTRLVQ